MTAIVETDMASTVAPAAELRGGRAGLFRRSEHLLRYATMVATGLVALGVVLRFFATSQLWLDEALTVNIARLPFGQIPGALRHDGAPPLYYYLLHFWMQIFGEGNFAVRALSGVISAGTLPFAWMAGKRLGGRRVAWASLLLLATSPFAINYATTARMYCLMILWTPLGFLALARALEQPSRLRLACVAAVTAAVLYTHYWGIYLVGVTGLWLLMRAKGRFAGRYLTGTASSTAHPVAATNGSTAHPAAATSGSTAHPVAVTHEVANTSAPNSSATNAAIAEGSIAAIAAEAASAALAVNGAGNAAVIEATAIIEATARLTDEATIESAPVAADPEQAGTVLTANDDHAATVDPTPVDPATASWSCFMAMAAGAAAFLPWLPSFIFQTLHTGTPWSNAAGLGDILTVLNQYAGAGPWGAALYLTLFALVLLGTFGESISGGHVLIKLNAHRPSSPVALIFIGTLLVAVLGGTIAQAAFVGRYTALVFPLFILLAAVGMSVFADRRVLAAILAWTACAGLIVAGGAQMSPRTQASSVASVINKYASPNDVVVYCPDQLGPAASRLITVNVRQYTFPRADPPERINWVDYRHAISSANVQQFADEILSIAAGHDIWFVQNPNYSGTEGKCSGLMEWLSARPNSQLWVGDNSNVSLENESLFRFPE